MLLFKRPFWEGLRDGSITVTFRSWARPHVKPGGRYRCHPIGVLQVDAIDTMPLAAVTDADARKAGFADRAAAIAYVRAGAAAELADDAPIYRIALHHAGEADFKDLGAEADLDADAASAIQARLDRLDRASTHGEWTRATLKLIAKNPRVAASKLASKVGRETAPFKADVVKLKKLGLTQSFEVGYALTPRGEAFLARRVRRSRAQPATAAGARPSARRAAPRRR